MVEAFVHKLTYLAPELALFAGAVLVSVLGLSRRRGMRNGLPGIVAVALGVGLVATPFVYNGAIADGATELALPRFVKIMTCVIGLLLVMLSVGLVDRRLERDVASGRVAFDPLRVSRGEYFAFFLLSLVGVMLCAGASDLIWLFLALELTSLPTYIMVAMSRPTRRAQEAAVKYFFLGAMSTAVLLYGFAMLYGAAGTIQLDAMREAFAARGELGLVGTVGAILVVLGLCFKIAAAPMHFYVADVYEGAAAPVTAFLGFVPKTAGMVALILVLSTIGWNASSAAGSSVGSLPHEILTTLWVVAVTTMTLGNVGALLQRSAKRMLAYSSIAHSGYMLIGVIAGPGWGINAVLFYLLVYGLMNTGAFAVLCGLERQGVEVESVDDLAGLRERHPAMAWALALTCGSLLGFPPLLGFVGKLYLFVAGVQAGQIALVVIAGLNSAISAWYYLRLAGLPILADPTARSETIESTPTRWPRVAAVIIAVAVVVLPIFGQRLLGAADGVTQSGSDAGTTAEAAAPAVVARSD